MPSSGVIVDYGMGNLFSVEKKFKRIGADVVVSNSLKTIEGADWLVLPGVGHFGAAVRNLRSSGMWSLLDDLAINKKTPILGICLGMQLMMEGSEEGDEHGFGWFQGSVKRFQMEDKLRFKVPHVGWNYLKEGVSDKRFEINSIAKPMYFVHSYYVEAHVETAVLAKTDYEIPFVSMVGNENIIGMQFHPEKSHNQGEQILKSFLTNVCI